MSAILFQIFYFAFLSFCLPISAADGIVDQTLLEYARAYRVDLDLSLAEDEKRRLDILDRFCENLPIYSGDHFFQILYLFLEKTVPAPANSYNIVDSESTFLRGKSLDKVFFIYDGDQKLAYVVKAFKNPHTLSSKFLQEISALELLQSLDLPHVGTICPMAAAIGIHNGEPLGLLLQSAASGIRMDQYVYAVSQLPPESSARRDLLKSVEKAFKRMGESLAHLHNHRSIQCVPLPKDYFKKLDEKIKAVFEDSFIRHSIALYMPLETFTSYLHFVIQQAKEVSLHLSYQHGDSHLGNMFYDEAEDKLYLIDNALLHKSLDRHKNPLLDGTSDLLRADEHFRRKSFGFLSQEEVEHLIDIYYASYLKISKILPDNRLVAFYRAYLKLGRLFNYRNYQEELDPHKRMRDQAIFTQVLEYFAETIP